MLNTWYTAHASDIKKQNATSRTGRDKCQRVYNDDISERSLVEYESPQQPLWPEGDGGG